eukprot:scaffold29272_cov64-Phaeocystis_antarctica.AAC.6
MDSDRDRYYTTTNTTTINSKLLDSPPPRIFARAERPRSGLVLRRQRCWRQTRQWSRHTPRFRKGVTRAGFCTRLSPQTSPVTCHLAPKKRARTVVAAATSASSPSQQGANKLTLHGGVPHHPSLAGLWRDERLTDFAFCAEGVEFKARRVVLASSSKYFLNLFESGMRDAADATHSLEDIRPKALEALLAFIYEGKCEIDEGLLTEVLEASARLVVDTLKEACADAIGARLAPSNVLNVWRLADTFTLPALEKAAVEAALRGFEELPPQLATGAEVLMLVQEDRLVARSEEAVFQWIKRWWEGGERPEAELLAVMKHVRFATMAEGFLRETVGVWPALGSAEARGMLLV